MGWEWGGWERYWLYSYVNPWVVLHDFRTSRIYMTITQKLGQRKDHPESLIRANHLPISALGSLFAMTIPQHGLPHLSRKATVPPVIPARFIGHRGRRRVSILCVIIMSVKLCTKVMYWPISLFDRPYDYGLVRWVGDGGWSGSGNDNSTGRTPTSNLGIGWNAVFDRPYDYGQVVPWGVGS